jgi:hypothetical protein
MTLNLIINITKIKINNLTNNKINKNINKQIYKVY